MPNTFTILPKCRNFAKIWPHCCYCSSSPSAQFGCGFANFQKQTQNIFKSIHNISECILQKKTKTKIRRTIFGLSVVAVVVAAISIVHFKNQI